MKQTKWFILLYLILLAIGGCATFRDELFQTGDRNEVILNAILDYSKTTSLYKRDSVFSVKTGEIDNDILIVRIGKNNMKLLLTDSIVVGAKGKFPSRYIEKDGKLFFWWDDNVPLTEDMLAVLYRYSQIQDDDDGLIQFPDFVINESLKAAHYYFCKNDLTVYKKVITNKGVGYYSPPNLKCDEK
jgi:hypothetical protein